MNISLNGMQKAFHTFTSSSNNNTKTTKEAAAKYTYAKTVIFGCACAILAAVTARWALGSGQVNNSANPNTNNSSLTTCSDLNEQNVTNITVQNLNSSISHEAVDLINSFVNPILVDTTQELNPLKNISCHRSESPDLNPVKRLALEAIKGLIKSGSNLDTLESNGYNLLMKSAMSGKINELRLLIDAGAALDLQSKHGDTALSLASSHNHPEAVTLLIKAGSPQDYRDKNRNTALFLAYHKGHLNVVKAFIAAGVDKTTVLDALARIVISNPTSLDQIEIVKLLIQECNKEDLEIVNNQGDTFLMRASSSGSLEKVKLLIEAGVDLNKHNAINWTTALMQAAGNNRLDTLKYLMERGAALNKQNVDGYTALHYAVINDRLDAVEMLISNKADLNVRSHQGKTALIQACISGNLGLVEVLAKAGADLNVISDEGFSAVGYALLNNRIEIFEKLLDFKADPNKLFSGKPPLWYLVNYQALDHGEQKLNAIRKLIRAGADKNIVHNGKTPLQSVENNWDPYAQRIKQILIEIK